ncbi:insulin-like peptide INSL5 [Eucyclogobius newberryi]|uniref:insulin-like peptide INSL5 n=1 Tax=Eucyclogobius newberryi TaxID=166745 RepID=UPI003B5A6FF1
MMHRPLLPALLLLPLLLCAALGPLQARAEVKAVKLCGREFLRAVVYTCGGSRWRRTGGDEDGEGGALGAETLGGRGLRAELWRRDMNSILTSVCCTMGCRKSDLSLLC